MDTLGTRPSVLIEEVHVLISEVHFSYLTTGISRVEVSLSQSVLNREVHCTMPLLPPCYNLVTRCPVYGGLQVSYYMYM